MFDYYKKVVFEKYATFQGRATRSEYWWFVLANAIIAFVLALVLGFIATSTDSPSIALLSHIYSLAVFIPGLAVTVRRLHDTNHSGWWVFISLIPFIGWIWILVLMCTASDNGENNYGAPEE